jgi:hypothetical protein
LLEVAEVAAVRCKTQVQEAWLGLAVVVALAAVWVVVLILLTMALT